MTASTHKNKTPQFFRIHLLPYLQHRFTAGQSFTWEVIATFLATMVGAMALMRYFSSKEVSILFIGTGFVGTGTLCLYRFPRFAGPPQKNLGLGDALDTNYAHSLEEKGSDYLRRMHLAAGRMSTLINDLLAFSHLSSESGKARRLQWCLS